MFFCYVTIWCFTTSKEHFKCFTTFYDLKIYYFTIGCLLLYTTLLFDVYYFAIRSFTTLQFDVLLLYNLMFYNFKIWCFALFYYFTIWCFTTLLFDALHCFTYTLQFDVLHFHFLELSLWKTPLPTESWFVFSKFSSKSAIYSRQIV